MRRMPLSPNGAIGWAGTPSACSPSRRRPARGELRHAIFEAVPTEEPPEAPPTAEPEFEAEHITYRPAGDQGFDVERLGEGVFEISGRGIEMLVGRHDTGNVEALAYLEQRLREIGVIAALRRAGFEPGDEVRIGAEAFELDPGE